MPVPYRRFQTRAMQKWIVENTNVSLGVDFVSASIITLAHTWTGEAIGQNIIKSIPHTFTDPTHVLALFGFVEMDMLASAILVRTVAAETMRLQGFAYATSASQELNNVNSSTPFNDSQLKRPMVNAPDCQAVYLHGAIEGTLMYTPDSAVRQGFVVRANDVRLINIWLDEVNINFELKKTGAAPNNLNRTVTLRHLI